MTSLTTTIQRIDDQQDEYLAVTQRDGGQEVCRSRFTFRPGQLVDLEPKWLLDRAVPRSAVDTVRSRDAAAQAAYQEKVTELAAYGQRLYGYLFGDGQALANFLKFAAGPRETIRLTLALHGNAARLWQLPWEYMHDGHNFLALAGRFQLVRRPEGLGNLPQAPLALPLRILVVVSAPDDQPLLDTEKEIGVLQEALDEAQRAGRVEVAYVDDATLANLGEQMRQFDPHVIHYTGHGAYDAAQGRSYLALEDEAGQSRPAGIDELRPHLPQAPNLRLVLLSGCQTAQTSDQDAFSGVATGLLAADIPAVVAMQFRIWDSSGIALAGAFYAALARGETLAAAVQAGRVALAQSDEGPGYDWGVPALYLRVPALQLVDPAGAVPPPPAGASPAALINMQGLPLPRHFVGRKPELRQLRRALRDNQVKAVFVRGIGGIGKSSVVARLIQRPGTPLDGVLTIRGHEVDALDIPLKLASFLQGQGQPGHAAAASLLLDSRQDPASRAQQAAALVAGRRYLLVFDNFESLQALPGGPDPGSPDPAGPAAAAYPVADPVLGGLLAGLLAANWRSLCVFTGRFRWQGFAEHVSRATAEEIHLPQLTARQAIMLMDNLPRLRHEPLQRKIAVWHKVGGHPKTIELLNGWLATGQVTDLLDDAALDRLLAPEWEAYFLRDLLGQLTPAGRQALARLAIFQAALDEAALAYAGVTPEETRRWLDLSLLQGVGGAEPALPPALLALLPPAEQAKLRAETGQVLVHPVVADYLLGQTDGAARRELHRWAAAYYGRPFVEMARAAVEQSGEAWTEEEIERLARSDRGVVGRMVARTDDLAAARGAMARALAWQRHLFAAGAVDAAGEIVTAVWLVLARWGQRDQAKGLLRRSIASRAGGNQAVAQGNLANLLMEEGKLAEALATHEAVYATFAALDGPGRGTKQQLAAALNMQSQVLQQMGELALASDKQMASLRLKEAIGDEAGQAISLHQLAMLYRMQADYPAALARSQAAEALARKLGNDAFLAAMLHEQGIIYIQMAGAAAAADGPAHRQQAAQCFQESLAISRRIGDEAGAASTLNELGKLLLEAGQMAEAIAAFNEALAIARKQNNPKMALSLESLGSVHERQGEYAAALGKYQEALALKQQYMAPQNVAITEANIARVRGKMGG